MGIPYSKQINAAFDQVTPLVSAGFEVLQTTKNISILLAAIQVVTVLILAAILLTLFALLISVNPDLEAERAAIVTPVVKWCACWAMPACEARGRVLVSGLVFVVVLFVGSWVWYSVATNVKEVAAEEAVAEDEEREGEGKGEAKGKAKGGKNGEGETKA
jgi:H+/Cl- antiporter ClcA